jgi:hypothetical protein
MTLRCLETSGFDYPLMQRHSTPERNPQQRHCEPPKSSKERHRSTDCYSSALTGLHHLYCRYSYVVLKPMARAKENQRLQNQKLLVAQSVNVFTMKLLHFTGTSAFVIYRFSV